MGISNLPNISKQSKNPFDNFINIFQTLSFKTEEDYSKMADIIAKKFNKIQNSIKILQFLKFLIKNLNTLNSEQYNILSSFCNIQKNIKQKEEKFTKKKKKKRKKKVLKIQSSNDFIESSQYDYQTDDFM